MGDGFHLDMRHHRRTIRNVEMEGHRPLVRVVVWLGHLLILTGASAGSVFALRVLAGDVDLPLQIVLPRLFPFAEMSLSVDGLSGFSCWSSAW
jgi:hypothetical protein